MPGNSREKTKMRKNIRLPNQQNGVSYRQSIKTFEQYIPLVSTKKELIHIRNLLAEEDFDYRFLEAVSQMVSAKAEEIGIRLSKDEGFHTLIKEAKENAEKAVGSKEKPGLEERKENIQPRQRRFRK